LPSDPVVIGIALACLFLMPLVRYKVAWLAAVVVFMWADSVMPGKPAALALRAPLLGALLLLGAFRFRGRPGSVSPPSAAIGLALLAGASVVYAEERAFAALSVAMLFALGLLVFGYLPRSVRN